MIRLGTCTAGQPSCLVNDLPCSSCTTRAPCGVDWPIIRSKQNTRGSSAARKAWCFAAFAAGDAGGPQGREAKIRERVDADDDVKTKGHVVFG